MAEILGDLRTECILRRCAMPNALLHVIGMFLLPRDNVDFSETRISASVMLNLYGRYRVELASEVGVPEDGTLFLIYRLLDSMQVVAVGI